MMQMQLFTNTGCYTHLAGGHLLSFLFLLVEKIGVSLAPLQPVDEDPLMAAMNLLELHWYLSRRSSS
jgi:hypothetical protein